MSFLTSLENPRQLDVSKKTVCQEWMAIPLPASSPTYPTFLSPLWNRLTNQGNCQLVRGFRMTGEVFHHPEASLRYHKRSGCSETFKKVIWFLKPPTSWTKRNRILGCGWWHGAIDIFTVLLDAASVAWCLGLGHTSCMKGGCRGALTQRVIPCVPRVDPGDQTESFFFFAQWVPLPKGHETGKNLPR